MNINTFALFPNIVTEVKCVSFETIQSDLIEWIYEYKSKNEDNGVQLSNVGGWQSKSNFFRDKTFEPFLEYILTHIEIGVKSNLDLPVRLNNMWINVNNKNDYNVSHTHGGVDLSGVFWVKTPEKSGGIVFESPNSFVDHSFFNAVNRDFAERYNTFPSFTISPLEGNILLFPAHLSHRVNRNLTDSDRISIAFNLNIVW